MIFNSSTSRDTSLELQFSSAPLCGDFLIKKLISSARQGEPADINTHHMTLKWANHFCGGTDGILGIVVDPCNIYQPEQVLNVKSVENQLSNTKDSAEIAGGS